MPRRPSQKSVVNALLQSIDPDEFRRFVTSLSSELYPDDLTIKQARVLVLEKARNGGTRCPCCGGHTQAYGWRDYFTPSMSLRNLYWLQNDLGWNRFFHHRTFNLDTGGKAAKSKYWGLCETHEPSYDGVEKKFSGFWRLTQKGRAYVEGKATIQEFAITIQGKVFIFGGPERDIRYVFPDDDLTVPVYKRGYDPNNFKKGHDYVEGRYPVRLEPLPEWMKK